MIVDLISDQSPWILNQLSPLSHPHNPAKHQNIMDSSEWQAEEMTIAEFHKLLRTDPSIGPELVHKYLEAINQHDGALNALILINIGAIQTARDKVLETTTLNKTNTPYPPLHSVPIILKDNISTANQPTSAGVRALKTLHTKADSVIVSQLRAAGAIILAKANLHEFALQGTTLSSLRGQTLNPYDLTRTPGGSSGGTGAALAANFGLAGCGTDTMNSLRSPASACGIVGFRPSTGRVSCVGIVPVSKTQDTAGPMGRCVADVRVLYRVMKGVEGSLSSVRGARRGEVRVGVLESYFQPEIHGYADADADVKSEYLAENRMVQDIVRRSLDSIQDQDRDIVLVPIDPSSHPDWSYETLLAKADTQAFEFKECLDEFLQSPLIKSTPHRSLESIAQSGEFESQAMTHVFSAALEDPETFSTTSEAYRSRLAYIATLEKSVDECFDHYDVDALAYPHQRQLAVKIGAKKQPGRNGVLAALTRRPAICIPGK
jgi:amidase